MILTTICQAEFNNITRQSSSQLEKLLANHIKKIYKNINYL